MRRDQIVVIYLRPRTWEVESADLDQRRAECAQFALEHDLVVAHAPFEDSGGACRSGLDAMIAYLRAHPEVGGVLMTSIDLLARRPGDLSALLRELGIRLWFADGALSGLRLGRPRSRP